VGPLSSTVVSETYNGTRYYSSTEYLFSDLIGKTILHITKRYRPHGTHSTQMLCQFQISILYARVVPDRRVDIILDAEYSEYKIVPGMTYVLSVPEFNILRVLGTRSPKLVPGRLTKHTHHFSYAVQVEYCASDLVGAVELLQY
jgi:hypothetical protein